jgi:probable rRNA maturation factor
MAPGDTGSKSTSRLRVSVCDAQGRPLRRPALAAWLARVAPARLRGEVTIALVSDGRIRALNRRWRSVDKATDVLSFPADETGTLGDIVIATGVAARQARDAGHAEATEHRVLALHGLLHLAGYDHEHDDGEMARVEARLRKRGGLTAGLIERAPGAAEGRALRTKRKMRRSTSQEGAAFSRATRR